MAKEKPTSDSSSSEASTKPEMKKIDAVRKAIARLGVEAKPLDLQDHIRSRFGIDMTTQMISNYKSNVAKEIAEKKANRQTREPAAKPPSASGAFSLEELQAVKDVADRIGADKVRQLAEILSK